MIHRFGLTKDQVRSLLPIINTQNTEIGTYCPKELKSYPGNDCGDGIGFRSINGRCNNFVHPHWGAAKLPFKRLLPPDYGDGKLFVRYVVIYLVKVINIFTSYESYTIFNDALHHRVSCGEF